MHKTAILPSLVPTVETRKNNPVFCSDTYADTWYVLAVVIQQLLYPWEEQRHSDGACSTLLLPG